MAEEHNSDLAKSDPKTPGVPEQTKGNGSVLAICLLAPIVFLLSITLMGYSK